MTATTPAIEVFGLTTSYGDHTVLNGIDLTVREGTVYALLGRNGAGKTTIVNILSTLLTPDDGEIRVAGFDLRREAAGVRSAIGLTGQFSAIDELLTGAENLRLMADLAHLDQTVMASTVAEMLARFDLVQAAADRRAQTYSGEGTAAELKRRVPGGHVSVQFTHAAALAAAAAVHSAASADTETLTLQVPSDGSIAALRRLLYGLNDHDVTGLTIESPDLDDVFLALTGRAAGAPESEEISAHP